MNMTAIQKRAAEAEGKNILVSAGAGTGKTRVLVERFLYFVKTGKALVTEILTLTFTEKAANEMKSRIYDGLANLKMEPAKRNLELAYISTIHAFAARVLREHPIEAGVDPDFRVIEGEETEFLKESALDEAIESECAPGTEAFELLRVYGEGTIRDGILKLWDGARHEGKSLREFFDGSPQSTGVPQADLEEVQRLLTGLDKKDLAADWREFAQLTVWDWPVVERFRVWSASFGRYGGKQTKLQWTRISEVCKRYLAARLDELAGPWRDRLENLALRFETVYENGKKEKGFLDFEDLQCKALGLFKKDDPLHRRIRAQYREKFRYILVDEFQDTSFLQMELIELLSAGDNLFLVGDFKQSIYGFRGAQPDVFLKKEAEYEEAATGARIPLVENFRTEESVLDFMNAFFKHLWREDNLKWDDLIAQVASSPAASVELLATELGEDEDTDTGRLREAAGIATRILELHGEGVPFGDIAVLFQAMTNSGIYEQALKRAGIPYFVIAGRNFYQQPEIRDMISYLSYLENPLSDIPLAAALRSPLFQISDGTLFWLAHTAKAADKDAALFEGLRKFEKVVEISAEQKEKLRFFMRVSSQLLAQKEQLMLTELLDKVLELTFAEILALADPQGIRRYANLRKLVSLAREYESYEPMPLGTFLRTLGRLETREIRESEAQVEAEKSGRVVRLLSVHRAKGLEFPVVFLADMAHQKQSPESKSILAECRWGYALKVRNPLTLAMENPLGWIELDNGQKDREKKEWKRLLYVAATRARTKLIMSGVHKPAAEGKESFYKMRSWMQWVMQMPEEILGSLRTRKKSRVKPHRIKPALAQRKEFIEKFGDLRAVPEEELFKDKKVSDRVKASSDKIFDRLEVLKPASSRVIDLSVSAYAAYRKDPAHYGRVYEIGYPDRRTAEEREPDADFDTDEISAADFGTMMHSFLERFDFKGPPPSIGIEDLKNHFRGVEESRLQEAAGMIHAFMKNNLFKRLARAKVIERELPFVLDERHGRIQGVIDVLFLDGDGWHILDYKTAKGDEAKVSQMGYDIQLKIYALAVSEILKAVPRSGILYFLENDWTHRVEFDAAKLADYGAGIRRQQEEMLEFRNRLER